MLYSYMHYYLTCKSTGNLLLEIICIEKQLTMIANEYNCGY